MSVTTRVPSWAKAVDGSRIYLLGYSLGAKVGLITGALDDRVKAVAAVAGIDPLRLDGDLGARCNVCGRQRRQVQY